MRSKRALREQPHVVRRDDVDAGQVLFLDDEAVDAAVHAELGIARDHDAGGDHRAAVVDRRHRDRQLVEIDVVADHAPPRGSASLARVCGGIGLAIAGGELVLDLAEGLAAHRHDGALLRADDAGHHRHVVADHVVEKERGLGLVDQRRDVADVDRLVQVDQLARLPQPVEELAEILLHFDGLQAAGVGPRSYWPQTDAAMPPGVYRCRPGQASHQCVTRVIRRAMASASRCHDHNPVDGIGLWVPACAGTTMGRSKNAYPRSPGLPLSLPRLAQSRASSIAAFEDGAGCGARQWPPRWSAGRRRAPRKGPRAPGPPPPSMHLGPGSSAR